jgi:hypothetical protein
MSDSACDEFAKKFPLIPPFCVGKEKVSGRVRTLFHGLDRPECVLACTHRHLGIDPSMTFIDATGRPRHLFEIREPIAELD